MKTFITKDVGRRKFLGDCGKMTGIGAMSSVINLQMMTNVVAQKAQSDFKAVVCLWMSGGNDSFNMLAPGNAGFAKYTNLRRQIAIKKGTASRIVSTDGKDQHLHRQMNGVRTMFNQGDLAFVCNVGTLVEPGLNRNNLNSKRQPNALGSHFDQSRQWQNSVPHLRAGTLASTGWIGRMSEILNEVNTPGALNMNISPSGASILQTSRTSRPQVFVDGANEFGLYLNNKPVRELVDGDLESQYENVLANHYNQTRKRAIEANNELAELEGVPFKTKFPSTPIGQDFKQVAVYIRAAKQLGHKRQTYFIRSAGHDAHRSVIGDLESKMPPISEALLAFNKAMKEINAHDKVITYTASDFGRNLRSNGSGSGHGWGSNQIVMGGPIKGKRFLGSYPVLDEKSGSQIIKGSGRVIPTTSIDQLHASIAFWFGVKNNSEMVDILPNIRNFWSGGDNKATGPLSNMFTTAALANRAI